MEEVGTQLPSPLLMNLSLGGRFCDGALPLIGTKRGLCFTSNPTHHPQIHHPSWNPNDWDWDCSRFLATPRPTPTPTPVDPHTLRLGTGSLVQVQNNDDNHQAGTSPPVQLVKPSTPEDSPPPSRPVKKVRSGSPGSGANYPMCQVDNCREDLSKAKDYHRRHKVCEFHSKATKALVAQQMQRFCQQCSRFHSLSEFDEGKRSCRRRLAGHNKRRRKTQAEDGAHPAVQPSDNNNTANGNLEIVNLLTALARGQGNAEQNISTCPPVPDNSQLIQMLSKINSLPLPMDATTTPLMPHSTKSGIEQAATGQKNLETNAASKSTTDLLTVLSATLAASSPDTLAFFSQLNNTGSCVDKNTTVGDKDAGLDSRKKATIELQPLSGERSSSSYHSPTEDSDSQVQDTRLNLPLQLFSSSPGEDSSPNVGPSRKYFSSDSSNPTEEKSLSSASPVTRNLFPLETTLETTKSVRVPLSEDANIHIEQSRTETSASKMTRELFSIGNRAFRNSLQNLPPQAGYSSSSGSDHSPPSFNSDPQKDRTGRIMFKLFDKDPSQFPGALRAQIYNWLSNSPSEMESYIRPGCVFLSIYLSMSSASWEQLEENFLQRVESLIQGSDFEFWRSGRFLVNIGRQLAIHKNGRIQICKPWSAVSSPELFMVSPLAVVNGEETTLLLKGRNFTYGTKVHCSYLGGHSSMELLRSPDQDSVHDVIIWSNFKVHTVASSVSGRCFIEVENGVRGNYFPIIIADAKICQELRLLECELNEAKGCDDAIDDQGQHIASPRSHEEVLHFLNELGWLFQRQICSDIAVQDLMLRRFQHLLTFSTERDYCALVRKLLDIFVESESTMDGLSTQSMEALASMHLLHRAVKRRSKKMVEMLIHYSAPCGSGSKNYIFPPNLPGPGGITPLHLAACTTDSYDIVDLLTDDPMQIGLHSWRFLLDDSGQSPYSYAIMRNDHGLNTIVAQKLENRINSHVSINIGSEIVDSLVPTDVRKKPNLQSNAKLNSCSKCATMSYSRMRGSHGFLHRPFVHSMLTIAAVCVCVCLFFKSLHVNSGTPFKWDNVEFGAM